MSEWDELTAPVAPAGEASSWDEVTYKPAATPPDYLKRPPEPSFAEGRMAGVRAMGHELLATGADKLATPGKIIAEMVGVDPNKADIEFAGIPLTGFARDQRAESKYERGIQQRNTPEGGAAQFGTELLDSAINMAPSVITGLVTKKGDLGLGVMGAQVFSTEMTNSLNEGKSEKEALKDAAIATLYEIGPEKAFGFFDDLPVAKGVKAWLRQIVAESVSEAATETGTILDERYRQQKDIGTFWDTLLRTGKAGAAGAVMGGGFGAGALLRGRGGVADATPTDPLSDMVEKANAEWLARIDKAENLPPAERTDDVPPPAPTEPQPLDLRQDLHAAIDEGRQANRPTMAPVTTVDPVQEALGRINTMAGQGPLLQEETAPVRESSPVQQEPTPVQERTEPEISAVERMKAEAAAMEQEREVLRQKFEETNSLRGVSQRDPGHEIILTEDMSGEGKYRVTHIRDGEPVGHSVYNNLTGGPPANNALAAFVGFDVVEQPKEKPFHEWEPQPLPPKPPSLLEYLAANKVRLDSSKFGGDLVTAQDNVRVGNKWLFEGRLLRKDGKGMGPEDLLEFLVEEGFMPAPDPNTPTQYTLHDAVEILNNALRGEEVRSINDEMAWNEYDDTVRYNEELEYAKAEALGLTTGSTEEEVSQAFEVGLQSENISDEEWADYLEQKASEWEATLQEAENVDQTAVQGTSESGQIVPEATPQETVKAAEQAKTAERNRLGEDVVPVESGPGELFAGNEPGVRPEQTDLVEQAEQIPDPADEAFKDVPAAPEPQPTETETGHPDVPGYKAEETYLSPEEAQARVNEWKRIAKAEARGPRASENNQRVILSLFDRTGQWSQPYEDAGYTVIRLDLDEEGYWPFDINQITAEWLFENGLETLHGIIAAPPCTDFAVSGARWFKDKDATGQTEFSLELVRQVLRIVDFAKPDFWVMENPVGRLPSLMPELGKPHMYFQPNWYGDPYTKKTGLWGMFNQNMPQAPVEATEGSRMHKLWGTDPEQKKQRSITPEGFSYAFFMANGSPNPNLLSIDEWLGDTVVDWMIMDGGNYWAAVRYAEDQIAQGNEPDERSLEDRGLDRDALNQLLAETEAQMESMGGDPQAVPVNEPKRAKERVKTKIVSEKSADAARKRLKSKVGTVRSGVDPEMYKDMLIVAAYHVERGARNAAELAQRLAQQIPNFAKWINENAERIWNDVNRQEQAARTPPKPPQAPQAAKGPYRPTGPTSTKNAARDAEREARKADPIFSEYFKSNPDVVADAEQAMADNPNLAEETMEDLRTNQYPSISRLTEAILVIYKTDIRRQMRQQADRMLDENISQSQRTVATAKYEELLDINNQIDEATSASGAVWGGIGQFRKRWMEEDYTFVKQVEKTAAILNRKPSKEQEAVIKKMTDRIAELEAQVEKANLKAQEAIDKAHNQNTIDSIYQQSKKQAKVPRGKRIDAAIQKELAAIRAGSFGTFGAGIPAAQMAHLAKLGGLLIAKGANTFAKWTAAMRDALGAKIFGHVEGSLKELWAMALDEHLAIEAELNEDTVDTLSAEAEALSEANEPLDHKLVYKIARYFVLQGMTNENEVMAAVTGVIQEYYPDISEREVRRMFSQYGQAQFPSQAQDRKTLRELRTLVRLQESIDRLKEGLDPKRTGPQRDKATQEIREKQRVLNALMRQHAADNPIPSREKLANINEQRITRLQNQIADLEKQLRTGEKPVKGEPVPDSPEVTRLKAKRDALKQRLKEIEDAKKVKLTPEEKYNELRAKQLRKQLAEVARRIREKDYLPKKRKEPPALSQENQDLIEELMVAKKKLYLQQLEWARSQFNWAEKLWDGWKQLANTTRAVKTSFDLSAVLRQGAFYVLSHPEIAIRSFVPMLKALRSNKFARQVNDEILSRPNARLYKKAGLFLAEQDSAHPTKMEEVYMGRWAEKIPGVGASARAYVTFLNKLRADVFDAALEKFGRNGQELTEKELKDLATFINNATGRANLKALNSEGLSSVFFAPRWVASRFNVLITYPWKTLPITGTHLTVQSKKLDAKVRKHVAGEYARFLVGYGILHTLAVLAFGGDDEDETVNWNPLSADFGKVRVGNTRLDTTAGMSNAIVFTARMATQHTENSRGEVMPLRYNNDGSNIRFGQREFNNVVLSFVRSKLAPIPASAWNLLAGKNVVGETYKERGQFMRDTVGMPPWIAENPFIQESFGMGVPLSMADYYDAMLEHGVPKATALQLLATLGVSMNTYDTNEKKEKGRPERPERPSRPNRPTRD